MLAAYTTSTTARVTAPAAARMTHFCPCPYELIILKGWGLAAHRSLLDPQQYGVRPPFLHNHQLIGAGAGMCHAGSSTAS